MDKRKYETDGKLPLLIELNIFFSLFNSKKGEEKYIHLVRYESPEDATDANEWDGKMNFISKIIQGAN